MIRQGAKLVETADDILAELAPLARVCMATDSPQPQKEQADAEDSSNNNEILDNEYQRLLDAMGYAPVAIDTLVDQTGLTPEEVSSMLLILELRGQIASSPGGLYTQLPT